MEPSRGVEPFDPTLEHIDDYIKSDSTIFALPMARAGESRSEARGSISFEGPIGPENTSGGGGGGRESPL